MGVYDVLFQRMHGLNRIVTRYHHKVCGIHIDRYACGAQAIQEAAQHLRGFRACFNGKVRVQAVGIFGQLAAGILHDVIARMRRILGNNANVGGYDIRAQLLGHVQNALGGFNQLGVELRIAKALAQVAADGGNNQAVIAHLRHKLFLHGGGNGFNGQQTMTAMGLNAGCAQLTGNIQRFSPGLAEGIQHNADGESRHKSIAPLQVVGIYFDMEARIPAAG